MYKIARVVLVLAVYLAVLLNISYLIAKVVWLCKLGLVTYSGWLQELARPIMLLAGTVAIAAPSRALDREVPYTLRRAAGSVLLLALPCMYPLLQLVNAVKSNVLMILEACVLLYILLREMCTVRGLLVMLLAVTCAHQLYETYFAIVRPFIDGVPLYVALAQPVSYAVLFLTCVEGVKSRRLLLAGLWMLLFSNIHLILHAYAGLILLRPPLDVVVAVCERLAVPIVYAGLRWRARCVIF